MKANRLLNPILRYKNVIRTQTSGSNRLFDESHDDLRETCIKVIDKEINPYIDEWEDKKRFSAHQVFKKLGDAGLLEYGGLGLDYSYQLAFTEEMGHINCGAIPMAIGVQTDMATPALARYGSDRLREQWLTPTITGDMVCCIGVSEPSAGSDVANIKTTARKDGDDYVINGSKMWITNGLQADFMTMLANTGDASVGGHKNKSLIVVPLDAKGVTRTRNIDKIGMWSSDTAELHFDNVRVPQWHLIGEEGKGFTYQMEQFQQERLCGAVILLKPMQRCIDLTIEYTRERKIFNGPVLDNQVIHFRLAELQTELSILKAGIYEAAAQFAAGRDMTLMASMCKLKSGRLSRELADACLQYWGGMGYTLENPVSRAYRDWRLFSIGAGADEVMLQIICKFMGTLAGARRA